MLDLLQTRSFSEPGSSLYELDQNAYMYIYFCDLLGEIERKYYLKHTFRFNLHEDDARKVEVTS